MTVLIGNFGGTQLGVFDPVIAIESKGIGSTQLTDFIIDFVILRITNDYCVP
jgi:hypothetical protein